MAAIHRRRPRARREIEAASYASLRYAFSFLFLDIKGITPIAALMYAKGIKGTTQIRAKMHTKNINIGTFFLTKPAV